ncbi:MAG: peptidylprolyl isomerase [Candidatus Poribacteria bacterium]
MKGWWQTTFLVILLFSGCTTAVRVNDSGKSTRELRKNADVEIAGQNEEEAVLAVVNGEKITMNDYNNKLKQLSAFEKARYRGESGHKEFLKALVRQKMMVQEAKKIGLDEDEEVRRKIELLTREVTEKVLVETLIQREVMDKTVVTDKEAKAYYDQHKDEFSEKEKAKARHILVATEEEAQKIRKELESGADFAKLAESKSIDRHTAKRGGDLGYFERGKMVPEFEKACFDLKVGEISDIVKTKFGYHIIKLEEKKPASVKEFYEANDEIKKKLLSDKQQKEYQKWLNQLEKKAKIKIDEDFFRK